MEVKKSKKQYVYICMIYLFYYAAYTSYFSFLTVYLSGCGFSKTQISQVFIATSLINLISQPLLGYLGDNKISVKKIVVIGMAVTIPGAFLLGPLAGVFPLAVASILLVAFFDYSMIGLLDTWTNLAKKENSRINYSVARGMGSFSSAVSALIIGKALTRFGNDKIFLFHAGFMIIALIFVCLFHEVPCACKKVGKSQKSSGIQQALKTLWDNKKYRYYIIAVFLVNMGWRAIVTYLPVIILDFGGTTEHQGISMALMTAGIAPFMFLYPRMLKRSNINTMLALGYFLTMMRVFSMVFVTNLNMLLIFQVFEAVSFGIFQPSMIEYISNITPAGSRALAVSTSSAVQMALCGTVGNYIAGIFLERFNFRYLYLLFGVISIFGFFMLIKSMKEPDVEPNLCI